MNHVDKNAKSIERLIEQGANVNATDKHRRTALHISAMHGLGAAKVANLLVDRGIDINATDDVNATALHKVAEDGISIRHQKSARK